MMIELRPATLDALDRLEVDTLVLFVSEADAPPQGITGLADWRLSGRLSRWMAGHFFAGQDGEKLLMPGLGRLYVQRVLGIGIGDRSHVDPALLREVGRLAGKALAAARIESAACSVPAVEPGDPSFPACARAFREGLARHFGGRLVLIGDVRALEDVFPKASADLETS